MLRSLVAIVVAIGLITGAIYFAVGRGAPPAIVIGQPDRVVGQTGSLEVTAEAPNARFTALTVSLEQNGKTIPVFTLDGTAAAPVFTQVDQTHVRIARPIGKRDLPDLQAGAARGGDDPERLDGVERAHILKVLAACRWRINGAGNAAERLGLHPNTLRFRMRKLGIARPPARRGRDTVPVPPRGR